MSFAAIWLGLKVFASGAVEWLGKALLEALKWLFSDWRNFTVLFTLWAILIALPGLRQERADNLAGWIAERAAHAQTVDLYRAAAAEALAEAKANAARVQADRDRINQEEVRDYQIRLADLRARRDELERLWRRRAPAADPGRADAAGVPGAVGPSADPAQAPADHRLPASGEGQPAGVIAANALCPEGRVCLTLEEAFIASAQAIQLDSLIEAVERHRAVALTSDEVGDEPQ